MSYGIITTVMRGTWILERTQNERFPYRLQIVRGDEPWLTLRAQDKWPIAGRHIFCLREDESPAPDEMLEEIERVDIIAFNEHGRRVSIVLDASDTSGATSSSSRNPTRGGLERAMNKSSG